MGIQFHYLRVVAINVLLSCGVFLLFASKTSAQGAPGFNEFKKMVDFLPPAPNAAALAKAAIFELNKNTGAPNVNLPIYTLKGRKLAVNIGITYATNGIKVDEIASRVGMGWSLNAGGVVSRTVRGVPDEKRPRQYPWSSIGTNWATFNYMKKVAESDNATGVDSQPDLFTFNFNSYSGSFVFDGGMNVVQMPYGNFKIEYDFATAAAWNFKITTTDGIVYFFGGPTATEKTKRDNTCGKNFDQFLATSWYLKKIEHPNGEVINLGYTPLEYTYDTGISESKELITENSATGGNCNFGTSTPQFISTNCANYTRTQGYYLTSIGSSTAVVNFNYSGRSDCSDVLLTSVEVYHSINSNNRFKKFDFSYLTSNTVPYLAHIRENSEDLSTGIFYQFMYNDPGSRPARLSKSQDHWGFYNGKNNQTLLPLVPELVSPNFLFANYFSGIPFGDRSPDFFYASKGMLKRIIYPTGGMDSIIYEPNSAGGVVQSLRSNEYTCEVRGTGLHDPVFKNIPFSINVSQTVNLQINVICNDVECPDNLHNVGTVSIAGTNFSEEYTTGTNTFAIVSLPPGNHTLTLRANGNVVTTRVKITYKTEINQVLANENSGCGVRVKALLSGNPKERPIYKRFYYAFLNDLEGTSVSGGFQPVYLKKYLSNDMNIMDMGSTVSFQQCRHDHTILYSSSIRNLYDYSSSLVSYASVIESLGENFEGGGTVTEYMVGWDQMGTAVWGNDIHDAPFTNGSIFYNGKVLRESILKKAADGGLLTIKKTQNNYVEDSRGFNEIIGYSVFRKNPLFIEYDTTCISTAIITNYSCWILLQTALNSFDMMEYRVFAPWTYLESSTVTNYDENGQNPSVTTTSYFYENEMHQQVTKTETHNSRGELVRTTNKYPSDFAASGNVYSQMISKNIITPLIDSRLDRNNAKIQEVRTNYNDWGNNIIAPASIQAAIRNNDLEIEGTINAYDAFGNILEYTGKDGIIHAIIYGYNYHYPIASISGATYSQAIAQLSVSVNALQFMTDAQLRTELNRIRTGLPNAVVTCYTYKPNIGVNCITDNNNRSTYYEYDGFGRLSVIRDHDNNILKTFEYAYAGPDGTLAFKLFFNEPQVQSFTCQNCPFGTAGSTVVYGVGEKKYFSFTSVQDANAKALAEIAARGQAYANVNGYCSNTICNSDPWKTINCNCEQGIIKPESCSGDPTGTWTQNYKYKWSDNSLSTQTYTRTMPPCTGVDKKFSDCACLVGIKIYSESTPNGDGTWTCHYRYRFTDGTFSAFYTEISPVACEGGL